VKIITQETEAGFSKRDQKDAKELTCNNRFCSDGEMRKAARIRGDNQSIIRCKPKKLHGFFGLKFLSGYGLRLSEVERFSPTVEHSKLISKLI
jgi:hypothetical protein